MHKKKSGMKRATPPPKKVSPKAELENKLRKASGDLRLSLIDRKNLIRKHNKEYLK